MIVERPAGERLRETVASFRETSDFVPEVAVVLGTGLSGLASQVDESAAISYADLPGFPRSTVETHAGRLVLGGGAQGSACALELARRDDVEGVVVADLDVSEPAPFLRPYIGEKVELRSVDAKNEDLVAAVGIGDIDLAARRADPSGGQLAILEGQLYVSAAKSVRWRIGYDQPARIDLRNDFAGIARQRHNTPLHCIADCLAMPKPTCIFQVDKLLLLGN